ncbi:sugar transferase [Apilactobacillus nanyangensis]|uniref:sugar transferase n=1 Tax=Apilactobacillus nanyangensis TaxID=2799579 RepID=UPI001F2A83B9|nr:sugar transferase [Apilactobacillus nanyangensis]
MEKDSTEYNKLNDKCIYRFFKRLTDIILSLFGILLILLFSLFIFVYYIFDKRDRGPIFFKQSRMGLHGETFYMYKFRSMVVNADEKLKENPTLYKKYLENNYKLEPRDDVRMTRIGTILRNTSIDELPQFLNVLKGDMSLVGPRPVVAVELREYDAKKLLSVKPGIMGLWQAQGRSNIGYPQRADIEMDYVDNASYWFDLKVLLKNIIIVLKKDGAY